MSPKDSITNFIAGTYWGKLFRRDKTLFSIVFLFFALSLVANIIKLQTTPFFIWSMYSHKLPPRDEYSFYEVRYNDNKLLNIRHTWEQPRKNFLFDPLTFYSSVYVDKTDPYYLRDYLRDRWAVKHPRFAGVIPGLYTDSAGFEAFPAWFKRYLSEQIDEPVGPIYILRKKVRFLPGGEIREVASDTTMKIP
jgi:hypothetical protein